MRRILIGLVLVFLDFDIDLGARRLGLLPNLNGYGLIAAGLRELEGESGRFQRARLFAVVLCVYSAGIYAAQLLGVMEQLELFALAPSLVGILLSLAMLYQIIRGVAEMEARHGTALGADDLDAVWLWLAVSQTAAAVSAVLWPLAAAVCLAAAVVCTLVYLVRFSRTKQRWEAFRSQPKA